MPILTNMAPVQSPESPERPNDRRALPVVILGGIIAVAPVIAAPSPGADGPITFAVRLLQLVAALAGVVTAAVGYTSYRGGDIRPAAAIGLSIGGVILVGTVGGLIETSGGLLIPIWVWILAGVTVVGVTYHTVYKTEKFES